MSTWTDSLKALVASYENAGDRVLEPRVDVTFDPIAQRLCATFDGYHSPMSHIEARAIEFAFHAHGAIDQRRKYTGDPYIVHPAAVARLVRSVPHTEEMLAAAWLHDTVEDTGVSLAEIHAEFGLDVAALVDWLTDVSKPEDSNRELRKARDREHTAMASPDAKTVKLADLIDNSESILARDPKFARVYIEEKALLLDVLREGDSTLHARAMAIVDAAMDALGMRCPICWCVGLHGCMGPWAPAPPCVTCGHHMSEHGDHAPGGRCEHGRCSCRSYTFPDEKTATEHAARVAAQTRP